MYTPAYSEIGDLATIHDLIDRFSFGTLVTAEAGRPVATHLPFVLRREQGELGTLVAHVARANPQWRSFGTVEALAVFQGAHAYVSPSWYASSPNVPTWNYAAAHAYGVPRVIEDPQEVRAALRELVDQHEAQRDPAWTMNDLPEDYLAGMTRGIVAFELPIARLEGKLKMSQNRTAADRAGATEALAASDDPVEREVGSIMRARS